jgi:hypothetical protein
MVANLGAASRADKREEFMLGANQLMWRVCSPHEINRNNEKQKTRAPAALTAAGNK